VRLWRIWLYGCILYIASPKSGGINFDGRPGTQGRINWDVSVNAPLIVNILDINLDERDTT